MLSATYEQIDSLYGIGPKLASLWMRIMNPKRANDFVVIDTHVKRFLRDDMGIKDESKKTYEELSQLLRHEACLRNITITQLDEIIVYNGINRRRGNLDALKPIPARVRKE